MEKKQDNSEVDRALKDVFSEIIRQVPEAIDCSEKEDLTTVLIPDTIDLRLVTKAALSKQA